MALDFAIQDDAGYPKQSVPIEWDVQIELIKQASESDHYPLILRMADYFQNTRYDADEVEKLMEELRRLKKEIALEPPPLSEDSEVLTSLRAMETLCLQAIQEGRQIVAIAD